MSLRRKLTTFVSNWLGVLIAAVIILSSASVGGILYGRSKVDTAINAATQTVTLRPIDGLVRRETGDQTQGQIYDIGLMVKDFYSTPVEITLSNLTITLDTYTFTITPDGSWDKTANSADQDGYQYFDGHFTIDPQTMAALVSKGKVDLFLKGHVAGSSQYRWMKRHYQQDFTRPIYGVLIQR